MLRTCFTQLVSALISGALILLPAPVRSDPLTEAAAVGAAANAQGRAGLDAGSAAAQVPGYSPTPPETGYRAGDRDAAGRARLAACALLPSDPLCQAQQGAMGSATAPRQTPGAAAVTAAHGVAGQPGTVLGNLSSFYSGCSGLPGQPSACQPGRYCINGRCFDTSSTPDPDFARSMTFMEAIREAGVYLDTTNMLVFNGEPNHCTTGLLTNCCRVDGSGHSMTNQSVFGTGSRLVYDALVNAGNRQFVAEGMEALLGGGGFSGAYSSYGVTVAVNGTALPAGSAVLYAGDTLVIAFDPWSLVIAIIIYVVMELLSCDPSEDMLAMKEGAGLCVAVGTYCSDCIKVLGKCVKCIEHTTSKCCFNSVLSRLINEQGRAQLGKGWGSDVNPSCNGFTVAELQSLDFSKMDLSTFYASIGNAASAIVPRASGRPASAAGP